MKITVKADQDIVTAVAAWALKKVQEDWDQPIVHDILDGLGIGAVRDPATDTQGQGAARLEKALQDFVTTNEKIAKKVSEAANMSERLRSMFDKICNKENWKLPINAVIRKEDENLAAQAIVFMTGGGEIVVTPTKQKGMVRIKAPGYYAVIGA